MIAEEEAVALTSSHSDSHKHTTHLAGSSKAARHDGEAGHGSRAAQPKCKDGLYRVPERQWASKQYLHWMQNQRHCC